MGARDHGFLSGSERATLDAFCGALLPPGGRVPATSGPDGVPVVERVERYLAQGPRRVRWVLRLALRAMEWSTFPRRFSRLAPAPRAAAIERMEARRPGPRRDLAFFIKTLSCLAWGTHPAPGAALGMVSGCRRPEPGPPERAAPALQASALVAPQGGEEADVVVVGSGAGGAAAARVLAEAGLSVLVLEAGGYHDAASYPHDPLEALVSLYRDAGLTLAEGAPAIPLPMGRCVGGTTVINSGTCFRTPEGILRRWRDEHGVAWATELDGEFEALERDLRIRPVDPATAGRNAALCRAGAEALGYRNGPIARNAGDVACCASCPTGCALDAKQATHVGELPRAVAAGARVRAGVRVEEILTRSGAAVGVAGRAAGARYEARARAVVLAGGALGTPELLLRHGLAGVAGRRLRIHPACWVGALYDEEVRGWDGIMQSWYVDEWRERGLYLEATFTPLGFGAHLLHGAGEAFRERVEAYDRLGVIGVHLSERSEGRVRAHRRSTRVTYRLRRDDAQALRFGIARAAEIHLAAGAREVYPLVAGLPVLRPGELGGLEGASIRPIDLRVEGFHPMGTARMGADPAVSVVDPAGQAHAVPGLYVADASLLPTSIGVNPMVTIMAMARVVARGLAARLS